MRPSSACFWISARVCSTESCRCAATSARSWERTRAARSSDRSPVSRNSHGPTIRPRPSTPERAGEQHVAGDPRPGRSARRRAPGRPPAGRPRPRGGRTTPRRRVPTTVRTRSTRPGGVHPALALRLVGLPPEHGQPGHRPRSTGQNSSGSPIQRCASSSPPSTTRPSPPAGPTSSSRRVRPCRLPCRVGGLEPGCLLLEVGRGRQDHPQAGVQHRAEPADQRGDHEERRAPVTGRRRGGRRARPRRRRATGRRVTGWPAAGGPASQGRWRCGS